MIGIKFLLLISNISLEIPYVLKATDVTGWPETVTGTEPQPAGQQIKYGAPVPPNQNITCCYKRKLYPEIHVKYGEKPSCKAELNYS